MIIAGILFVFGILIGIQILYLLLSPAFWRFIAYCLPILGFFTLFILKNEGHFWTGLIVLLCLSIPMYILEIKNERQNKKIIEQVKKDNVID